MSASWIRSSVVAFVCLALVAGLLAAALTAGQATFKGTNRTARSRPPPAPRRSPSFTAALDRGHRLINVMLHWPRCRLDCHL